VEAERRVGAPRTLWDEGRLPGHRVVLLACAALAVVVLVDVTLTSRLSLLFDLAFVGTCVAAAMGVRPRDFFVTGVLPPLMMFGTVLVLALTSRGSVARVEDGVVQAVVSGLAHHATALVAGYGCALGVLAIRQASAQRLTSAGPLR
jgi:hypothetical protein